MFDFSKRTRIAAIASLALLFALVGCGGDVNEGAATTPPASTTVSVGVEGGTVTGPDGVQVVIPAGALDKPTEIGIARSAVGAPPEPDAYPASGYVYEITPHGLTFNSLVTVRAPIPGGASAPQAFMASVGEGWKLMDAQIVNGMLEWQRNSFSNLLIGAFCSVPTAMANDPYWCRHSISYARVTATPSAALVQTSTGDPIRGDAGSYRVDQAAALQFKTNFSIPGNCSNVAVKLRRFAYEGTATRTWGPPVVLQTKTPVLTVDGGVNRGVETFDLSFAHQLTGRNLFSVVIHYDCPTVTRSSGTVTGWNNSVLRSEYVGDGMIVVGNVPAPTVFHTVGGSVSGLTGSGLVLQNNGGDNRAVTANGAFGFATSLGAGAPYAVSVLTQPAGQTCSVQNGSGTANAVVSNVLVSCAVASAKAWQGAGLLETLDAGEALEPRIAFDTQGNAIAIWSQVSSVGGKYKIYARRYAPATGWGAVAQIPTDPLWNNDYSSPQIAFTSNGNAVAVFSGCIPDGCAIWTAQFTAATASWAMATQLFANAGNSPQPQIAIDSAGNALVVWRETVGISSRILAGRYEASTSTWGAARVLSADLGGFNPKIAFDASGNAIAIWAMRDTATAAGYKLMSDRYVAGSGWHPQGLPTTIATSAAGAVGSHRLAVDAAGSAMAVWTQHDGTTESIYSSRHVAGAWGAPALVETSSNWVGSVSVAMDGNGNAIVVWYEADNGDVTSIWARRYVAGVGGTAVRIDDSSSYTSGGFPQIAMDATGNAMAVWNQGSYTWANRYVAGSGWAGATLIDSAAAGGSSSAPQVAVDANGNAIAVWPHSGVSGPNIWGNVFR